MRHIHLLLLATATALCASSALAQSNLDWDNGGSAINNNWSTGDNWLPNSPPTPTAPYNNIRVGGGFTSNLDANYTVNSVTLLNASGHTVTAGGGTLSINSATKSGSFYAVYNAQTNGVLTINAPIQMSPTDLTGNATYRITPGNATATIYVASVTMNDPVNSGSYTLSVQTAGTSAINSGTASIGTLVGAKTFTAGAAVTNLGASANFTGVLDIGIGNAATLNLLGNIGNNGNSTGMVGNGARINLANGVTFQRNVVGRNGDDYAAHYFGSAAGVTGTAEFSGTFTNSNGRPTPSVTNTAFVLEPFESGMTITYSGAFTAASQTIIKKSVVKAGAGVAVLTGTIGTAAGDYFQGGVAVSAGTLRLGNNQRIYDGTPVTLSGGTLDLNGYDETAGTLKLAGNAAIAFAAGSDLAFADSSAIAWTGELVITGWASGNTLRFGTSSGALTPDQLGKIKFGTTAAQIDASGYVTPATGGEPATPVLAIGLSGTDLLITCTGESGVSYLLESSADLSAGDWPDVETKTGTGGFLTFTVPVPAAGQKAFYRVVVPAP